VCRITWGLAEHLVPRLLFVVLLVRLVDRLGVEPAALLEARERVGGRVIRALAPASAAAATTTARSPLVRRAAFDVSVASLPRAPYIALRCASFV
jgi:hypothetical protein